MAAASAGSKNTRRGPGIFLPAYLSIDKAIMAPAGQCRCPADGSAPFSDIANCCDKPTFPLIQAIV